ncbi:TetR/AcrR family transcriptional regulator [Pendulispora albinea]|uniref:TetR/AcrR family transcriptional regulator n=1 Tax=Pendulispora albinea TaxID=2741071 RepID=A0ABZ2M080_9BACT
MGLMPAGREQPKQLRGEQLVAKIIDATMAELGRVDFESLSMETVAERAGVNKTTLYRRWPTKLDLVRTTLEHVADRHVVVADRGSLRADLTHFLRAFRDLCRSPDMIGIMRLVFGGKIHPDLAALTDTIREQKDRESRQMIERAIARGELPRGLDVTLMVDTLCGSVMNIMFFQSQPCDDAKLERLMDMLLLGAENGGGRIAARVPRPRAAKSASNGSSRRPRGAS